MNAHRRRRRVSPVFPLAAVLLLSSLVLAQDPAKSNKSPAEGLPPWIQRLTHFGERADFSHDGKRVLFLEKTFGDVFEIDLATRIIRPITHHYPHAGYVRALYLANGDILLSGAKTFDSDHADAARTRDPELWILDRSLTKPPVRLNEKCAEGPAVSRTQMRIAWTINDALYPDRLAKGQSQIWMADIVYENGSPKLANKKLVLDSQALPFKCSLETQNFRPPHEKELIFSAYGYQGTDVMGVDLQTGQVVNYSNSPSQYDEPEGIFPDGQYTLVECDKHNLKGYQNIDIYKLKLDGSALYTRLTYFNDYPGCKASNPVVSDDGRFIAFQLAKTSEAAGVGHGIFLFDLAHLQAAK
ncbi:MAG TPA: hypothetical protein VHP11_07210 [Tepidisphaeraceae bacterium]|nr:hypothetical protein [Tepidisphaeraceae bacterium]